MARHLGRQAAGIEIVLINPADYFLYLPLLSEVVGSVLDPGRVAVPLPDTCPGARLVVGTVEEIDLRDRRVSVAGPGGDRSTVPYDRLLLTAGSVNKLLPVPGVAQHGHGFRSVAEALYLRDHLLRQLELAATGDPAERPATHPRRGPPALRPARSAAPLAAARPGPARAARTGPAALGRRAPHLDQARRGDPDRHHGHRGNQRRRAAIRRPVRAHPLAHLVRRRAPDPLVAQLGLPTTNGRLNVDEYLTVPGHPDVAACGDIAAVPDLTRPGQLTPHDRPARRTAGKLAARNIAASLGDGRHGAYRHHDLGFLVDLGGAAAAANPLGVPLSGLPAKVLDSTPSQARDPASLAATTAGILAGQPPMPRLEPHSNLAATHSTCQTAGHRPCPEFSSGTGCRSVRGSGRAGGPG